MKIWVAEYGYSYEGPIRASRFFHEEVARAWLESERKAHSTEFDYYQVYEVPVFRTLEEDREWVKRRQREARAKAEQYRKDHGPCNTQLSDQLKELLDEGKDL